MMRKYLKPTLGLLAITALLSACGQPNSPTATQPKSAIQAGLAQVGDLKYVENEVVISYKDQASLDSAVQKLGGTVIATIPEIRVALVQVAGDAFKEAYKVRGVSGIRYAQPNAVSATAEPTTVSNNLNQLSIPADQVFDVLPQYALDPRHLNAKAAWDAGMTGKGVIVGVMDDPGDVSHPDLTANWAGKAYDSYSDQVYTDVKSWVDHVASPYASHGTFVASSIVAAKDGKGIVGVAPDAKFFPIMINPARKATNEFYSDFAIARAAVWGTNNGARVLNNSWGGGLGIGPAKDAFDYAMSQGVVVVASAGNSYRDQFQYPAGEPGVIASVALDASNRRVTFSTHGRHVSTGAPGQDVMLANPTWQWGKGDTDKYELISGTSFSGPYTAGVAALIIGKCPNVTPYQVRRIMEMNADGSIGSNPNGFDRDTGWGRLDAGKIAASLKDCSALPDKGANVQVTVKFLDLSGTHPGYLADVMLRGQGLRPGATDDSTPWYITSANEDGEAHFSEIAPGTYDVYAAGSDLDITGGAPEDRGTYLGTLTATSGSTFMNPDRKLIVLTAKSPDLNPVDPYEPNDTPAEATPIAYGQTTKVAYIFGKPQDADYFKFVGKAGDKILADVLARGQIGGRLDSYMFLYDTNGTKILAENDDRGNPRIDSDSEIAYTLPADGTYYIKVSSCSISCNPKAPQDDDSPFNKYQLKLQKTN